LTTSPDAPRQLLKQSSRFATTDALEREQRAGLRFCDQPYHQVVAVIERQQAL
jgi:hypothetical protein